MKSVIPLGPDHAGELRRADEVPWQARHASLVAQNADAERNAEIARVEGEQLVSRSR